MWTLSRTLGGNTTEGEPGMRTTKDRIAQYTAFALVAAGFMTLVLLALHL